MGGVVDGRDAGLRGVERPWFAHGVDRNYSTESTRFRDGGGELLGSKHDTVFVTPPVDHLVRPGLVDLGEIRTFLMLLPHDFDKLCGGVGVVGVGEDAAFAGL